MDINQIMPIKLLVSKYTKQEKNSIKNRGDVCTYVGRFPI